MVIVSGSLEMNLDCHLSEILFIICTFDVKRGVCFANC